MSHELNLSLIHPSGREAAVRDLESGDVVGFQLAGFNP